MSGDTETAKGSAQIIRDTSGNPLYAVVPFDEYQALLDADSRVTIPHEVVALMIEKTSARWLHGASIAVFLRRNWPRNWG